MSINYANIISIYIGGIFSGNLSYRDTLCKQELFDIAIAMAEMAMEPNSVADDLNGEAVIFIVVDG